MAFAERTKVPVGRSRDEIEAIVRKRGSTSFGVLGEDGRVVIVFVLGDRRIRFAMAFAPKASEQTIRAHWRALLLVIKAKLEAVDTGIETLEEAFLAQIVMPDGSTVAERALPAIAHAYDTQTMVPLLPPPAG